MATSPTVVIWNANAGSVEQATQVRAQLAVRPDTQVYESTSPEEAQQIVKDACQGGEVLIVAAGGDGTINTVANAMPKYESHVRLAVLPVGTANDWCWSLGIPDDLTNAVQLLETGETRLLDLAEMETDAGKHCFANVATGGNSQRVTDLLTDDDQAITSLRRLRYAGHDVILFHILDEAEVRFPFKGLVEFEEPESTDKLQVDADSYRADYLEEVAAFREKYRQECFQSGIDYVPIDTSMMFDKALTEYLVSRRARC